MALFRRLVTFEKPICWVLSAFCVQRPSAWRHSFRTAVISSGRGSPSSQGNGSCVDVTGWFRRPSCVPARRRSVLPLWCCELGHRVCPPQPAGRLHTSVLLLHVDQIDSVQRRRHPRLVTSRRISCIKYIFNCRSWWITLILEMENLSAINFLNKK